MDVQRFYVVVECGTHSVWRGESRPFFVVFLCILLCYRAGGAGAAL